MERLLSPLRTPWRTSKPMRSSSEDEYSTSRSPFVTVAHGLHNMELCSACEALDVRRLQDLAYHRHLRDVFDLVETSKACRLCSLLAAHLVRKQVSTRLDSAIGSDSHRALKIPMVVKSQADGILEFSGFQYGPIQLDIYSQSGMILPQSALQLH
jgi:hypothetical protein